MINKRIQKIGEFVNKKVIAEIGADHGLITKFLFDTKKISHAFLTDISAKSLQKAVNNFSSKKYKNKTFFAVGDGLDALDTDKPFEPMQIIIAGMGGKEIIKILSKNVSYKNFVLQPQKNAVELRNFLLNNNYHIQKDETVFDGKMFYNVLSVKKSDKKQNLTKNQILFGKTNLKYMPQDFVSYLKYEKEKNDQILSVKNVKEINKKQNIIKTLLEKGEKQNV